MNVPDSGEILDGTVTGILFRNEDSGYSVLNVAISSSSGGVFRTGGSEVVVVGNCAAVWVGEELHATGQWVDDPARGRRFKAKAITCITPTSVEGIRRYLASGLIKGIGPVLANRIVDKFGGETLNILDRQSERLKEIDKLGPKKIEGIRRAWKEQRSTRELMIFTQSYGISVTKTAKIFRQYGPDSVAVIKSDPYRLCRDIWGIGFQTADAIAMSVGMPKDSPLRARAAILHILQSEADDGGHIWTGETELLLLAEEKVGIGVEKLAEALKSEIDEGRVIKEENRIYMRELYFCECAVAKKLCDLLSSPRSFPKIDPDKALDWWERKTGFTLAPAQTSAVLKGLESKVFVITGGPGVGKTTIIRALVDIYAARKGANSITTLLAAPTGRAAKRMTESTGAPAQTMHRLLKYNPQTGKFTYCETNPIKGDVFIFDETSMVDIRLMERLLAALPDTATLILVGDTDQLPSVGPGSVLGDCIKSGVIPVAHLTEIFRQDSSGLIVRNAHHVNAGEMFETNNGGESDFYYIAKNGPEDVLKLALDFMTERIPRHFKMEPLQDVQVLTPMRKNLLGSEHLNEAIQERLNPGGIGIRRGGTLFKAGDRVMQLRNNYDKDVFNGDVGFVQSVDASSRSLVALFDGRPVQYASGDLDELALAYATTIHKSQGSEYPAVVVLLHNQHYMMLQRNLLYTAITRGRRLVLVIGSHWAVQKAIETNTVLMRRTRLDARLAAWYNTPCYEQ